ncbi:MAG TPA: DUF6125 family protein [Syntrophales bacterium]|mgnify:CR=1 FL=1|nr:DUF6125 family protein [Syntrophales bacterium]HOL59069.1 DUF6125 family protein [Syntrophales bacterium]HPO35422.1 DUF6125 family protein [Syntrophales bacterium]
MFPLDKWDKEHLYSTMRELLYSFNFTWFVTEEWIKKNCTPEKAKEGMLYLSGEFGAYEAKRIARIIPKDREGIDKLITFLEHSHWFAFEDMVTKKISPQSFIMATRNCTSQKAAQKWGMGYYDCAEGALKLRTSFFTQIDPRAQVQRIFTPPAPPAEGFDSSISCAWIISLG